MDRARTRHFDTRSGIGKVHRASRMLPAGMTTPHLVLLPGMDGTGMLFAPFTETLPSSTVVTAHRYPVDEALSYEDLLPRVLPTLPPRAPFVLLGESFSGPLALMVASTAPPGLVAVVLCASFARRPLAVPTHLHGVVRGPLLAVAPFEAQVQAMLGGYATPRLRAMLAQALGLVPHAVMASRIRTMLRLDVTDALRRCPVPLLYLRPKRDRLVFEQSVRHIVTTRPDTHVERIDGPHLILQTRPEACRDAITTFLASHVRT